MDGYFLFIECSQHFSLVSSSSRTKINRKAYGCKMGMKNEIKRNACGNAKIHIWDAGCQTQALPSSLCFLRESTSVVAPLTRLSWLRRWLSGEGASCANMRTCVHVPSICVKRELQNKSVAPVLGKREETDAGVHWLASLVEEVTSRIARRRPCLKHSEWELEGRLSC